jgi:hypothetical protein
VTHKHLEKENYNHKLSRAFVTEEIKYWEMSRKRSSDTKVIKFDNQDMLITSSSTDGKSYSPTRARPKLRVRIKKWHGIAHWTWNCGEEDDLCGICQSPYEGVAPNCKYPGDECPVVWVSTENPDSSKLIVDIANVIFKNISCIFSIIMMPW